MTSCRGLVSRGMGRITTTVVMKTLAARMTKLRKSRISVAETWAKIVKAKFTRRSEKSRDQAKEDDLLMVGKALRTITKTSSGRCISRGQTLRRIPMRATLKWSHLKKRKIPETPQSAILASKAETPRDDIFRKMTPVAAFANNPEARRSRVKILKKSAKLMRMTLTQMNLISPRRKSTSQTVRRRATNGFHQRHLTTRRRRSTTATWTRPCRRSTRSVRPTTSARATNKP